MLENAIYSVISPEGCASILWRDPKKSLEAADAMKLSSKDLLELGIIDEIIKEPLGGAHRDKNELLNEVKKTISQNLLELSSLNREDILNHRKKKFLLIGRSKGINVDVKKVDTMIMQESILSNLKDKIYRNKKTTYVLLILVILFSLMLLYL